MPRRSKKCEFSDGAIIGIDHGSTATRVSIFLPGNTGHPEQEFFVHNLRNWSTSGRYEKSDFSSRGFVFDDLKPVYEGLEPNQDTFREGISLKYGFYHLSEPLPADLLLQQYPFVGRFKDDEAFRERLREGQEELFTAIRNRVGETLEQRKLHAKYVALSVPAQWSLEMCDYYCDLVSDIFKGLKHPPQEVVCHTEITALIHYMLRDPTNGLGLTGKDQALLLLDFGGHSMNGAAIAIVEGKNKQKTFFTMDQPFGAGGGSEQWEYLLGEMVAKNIGLSSSNKQKLLDQFHSNKPQLGPQFRNKPMEFNFSIKNRANRYVVPATAIAETCERAFEAPIRMAEEKIAWIAATVESSRLRVIVSGGSSQHTYVQDCLKELCAKYGLSQPRFTHHVDLHYNSAKIARGAAYATANSMTKEEFISQAAFAMHMRQADDNRHRYWDSGCYFMWSQSRQVNFEDEMRDGEELRLVCAPFYNVAKTTKMIPHYKTYAFIDLPPMTGLLRFQIAVEGSGDDAHIVLQVSRKRLGKRGGYLLEKSFVIQVLFDQGVNCIFPDESSMVALRVESSEVLKAIPVSPTTNKAKNIIHAHKLRSQAATGSLKPSSETPPFTAETRSKRKRRAADKSPRRGRSLDLRHPPERAEKRQRLELDEEFEPSVYDGLEQGPRQSVSDILLLQPEAPPGTAPGAGTDGEPETSQFEAPTQPPVTALVQASEAIPSSETWGNISMAKQLASIALKVAMDETPVVPTAPSSNEKPECSLHYHHVNSYWRAVNHEREPLERE